MQLQEVISTPAARDNQLISDEEAEALARTIINLIKAWDLTDAEAKTLLGGISTSTLSRWKNHNFPTFSRDLRMRMAHLIGIHKGIRFLFKEPERGYRWVKRGNEMLQGRSPLKIMLGGELEDLSRMRQWLNSLRSAW